MSLQARAPPRCQNDRVPRQAHRKFHLRADGPGYQHDGRQNMEYHTGQIPSQRDRYGSKRVRSAQCRGSDIPSRGQAHRFPGNIFDFIIIRPHTPQSVHHRRANLVWRRRLLRIRLRNPATERAGCLARHQPKAGAATAAPASRGAHKAPPPYAPRARRADLVALPKAHTGQRGPDMRAVRQHKLQKFPFRAHSHKAVNKHIIAGKIPSLE